MKLNRLKLELMHYGIEPTRTALGSLPRSKFSEITYKDYATTGGLIISLSKDIYANVPIVYDKNIVKKFYLDFKDLENQFIVKCQDLEIKVAILSPPFFALHNTKTADGEPVRNMVMSHADRVRISPISGCSFNCNFCNMPSLLYKKYPIEMLDKAFNVALKDEFLKPRHALISGGTPYDEKRDYAFLNGVYEYFLCKYPDMKFDIMTIPRTIHPGNASKRKYINFLLFLKQKGAESISVNIELFNENIRKKVVPEKGKIGIDNYLLFLEQAAEIFGERKVRSILVAGLEPEEDTLAGVDAIASRGCLTEISPFIPDKSSFLALEKPPSVDFLETLMLKASEISEKHGVPLKPFCKLCSHNII